MMLSKTGRNWLVLLILALLVLAILFAIFMVPIKKWASFDSFLESLP